MPNIDLLTKYNSEYPEKNIPFLSEQNADWEARKPLRGVKILHNLVNTFETLHKLEPLLRAGADLTVTRLDLIRTPYLEEVEQLIRNCGIRYIPDYKDLSGTYDIGMDCAARLRAIEGISFHLGIVELTQSGTLIYKNSKNPYPVISVDDSHLKNLECMYGTGEAFIRAFREFTNEDLRDKFFLIFGYGKIGRGITKYLSPYTKYITIVEKSTKALALAKRNHIKTIHADLKEEVKSAASNAFAIVTATGAPNILSSYIIPSEIKAKYVANMGADDEIGANFSDYKGILYNRNPINFGLKHPTRMKYLDPIFFAHNLAAELLITSNLRENPTYYPLDPQIDRDIIRRWTQIHNEEVEDIWD